MLLRTRCLCFAVVSIAVTAHAQSSDTESGKLASAQVLERSAYVQAVLRVNPSVAAARDGWRAALARMRQAGSFDDPMVEASLAPLSIASSRARFGVEVGVSQALPWFGKRALERDVMKAEAAAAASDLERTRRELAMTAVTLYAQYYVNLKALEINTHYLELMTSLRDVATAELESGRGSVQDAIQADAELSRFERDAIELSAARDVVVAQMNELLHRAPTARLPPTPTSLVVDETVQPLVADRLATEAVRSRAEIVSARLHARAESLKEDSARRAYYPTITLSTSYNSMWDMPEHRWMLGVGVNVPLPSERRAGAIDEARATRAQYQNEVARMSAGVRSEVYIALRNLDESTQLLDLFRRRLLPVARDRVEAAQASFRASRAPFASIIEAQKSLRSVELDHEMVQAEWERRRAEVDRVAGRIPGLPGGGGEP